MTVVGVIAGRMKEMRVTAEECATIAGMSTKTFRRRLNRPETFTTGELDRLAAFLRCKEDIRRVI